MRQFPYAQRSHPTAYRGDAAQQQQQQQQQQQPLPQRDTMSDMQEQFSKLAESTLSLSLLLWSPLEIQFCIACGLALFRDSLPQYSL
jgi:hypothetical protein